MYSRVHDFQNNNTEPFQTKDVPLQIFLLYTGTVKCRNVCKTKYYADRVRHLQKTDSKNWHRQVKVMTRNSSTDVCIQVPDVQAYKHNEIANAINCKFVNVSASMAPLDYSNLPAVFTSKGFTTMFVPMECVFSFKEDQCF